MISPYLSMSLPDVLITTGSDYATQINNAFLVIDALVGQSFTPSQLNINQDLSFQNHNPTNQRSSRFTNQTASLALASDVNELYVQNGDLYYVDVSGNQVQLTVNGTLNAALVGGITGLGGTNAGLLYSAGSTTFTLLANTGTLAQANIDVANATVRGQLLNTGSAGAYFDQKVNAGTNATGSFRAYTTNGDIVLSSSGIGQIRLGGIVSASGDINAPGGYRQQVDMGGFFGGVSTVAPNSGWTTFVLNKGYTKGDGIVVFSTSSDGYWVAPFSGSLLAIQAYSVAINPNPATVITASVNFTGTMGAVTQKAYFNQLAYPAGNGGNNSYVATFAKDTVKFDPGSYVNFFIALSQSAVVKQFNGWITVEC